MEGVGGCCHHGPTRVALLFPLQTQGICSAGAAPRLRCLDLERFLFQVRRTGKLRSTGAVRGRGFQSILWVGQQCG